MTDALKITAGEFAFDARFETANAPKTDAAFKVSMPFISQIVHVRWSGEGGWVHLVETYFGGGYENHTSQPAPARSSSIPAGSARPRSC